MQSAERYSWSALTGLAESLREQVTPFPIRFTRALPTTRALLRELGIDGAWFIDESEVSSTSWIASG
jgi:hypothetical protein